MLAVVRVTVQSVFKNYAAIVRISSDLVEISSELVRISSELVRISSELVTTSLKLMIISTFRKTDQKGFPNAYFYATKNNLGTNIFTSISFLATTPIRRRLGKAKEKHAFLYFCIRLAPFGFAQIRRRLGKAKEKLVFLLLCTRLALTLHQNK